MLDKTCLIENIRSRFKDGMIVMVGGFGVPGTPFTLIDALLATGASDLTLIKNEANEDHMGLSKLIEAGRCKKIITSHLGLNATVIGFMNRGEIEVDARTPAAEARPATERRRGPGRRSSFGP